MFAGVEDPKGVFYRRRRRRQSAKVNPNKHTTKTTNRREAETVDLDEQTN